MLGVRILTLEGDYFMQWDFFLLFYWQNVKTKIRKITPVQLVK